MTQQGQSAALWTATQLAPTCLLRSVVASVERRVDLRYMLLQAHPFGSWC